MKKVAYNIKTSDAEFDARRIRNAKRLEKARMTLTLTELTIMVWRGDKYRLN